MKLNEIIKFLEELAPPALQENYDNSGLLVGDASMKVNKAIVSLDMTEAVVDEAIAKNANLIIAHHPIIFSGLKRLNGKNYIERTIIKAIKNDIALYAIHTNLDNVIDGVNKRIADKLGLENTKILAPKTQELFKLVTFTPVQEKENILTALFAAGGGQIGNYTEASFTTQGIGTFKGNDHTNPTIGEKGVREYVEEVKIEVLVNKHNKSKVLAALQKAHIYEEVAYDLIPLSNIDTQIGSGMIGELKEPQDIEQFFRGIKQTFQVPAIKHTAILKNKIERVALCGGSGSFLLNAAIQQQADVFITADFKYHQFFDAENQVVIADIGHYESEQFTSELLIEKLNKKFRNFAVILTEINTNPVQYFI